MAYQALYRQWRPATFSQMVSQEGVIATLRNQVMTGRIAHAYLFCGSRGTGKTSTAKIMSRAINCEHPVNGDPCGECESCKRLQHDGSLDVVEIDAASNNGVDEMRDLRDTVKYPPQYGKYKVYIIDEVHMLSTSAFNALLKTLEEPPAYVVFILATTEPQKLPATILSRCQRYDFGRIPVDQIAGRLREAADAAEREADDSALRTIARAAEGGMRDALSILDMCLGCGEKVDDKLVRRVLGTSSREFLFRFSDALQKTDAAALLNLIDELMRTGHDAAVFSREMADHIRALLLAKICPEQMPSLLDITEEDAAEYVQQTAGFPETRLLSMMELFMNVESEMRYASSPRLALESAAMKACLRTGENDTAALTERIAMLESQLAELQQQLARGAIQVSAASSVQTASKSKNTAAAANQTEVPVDSDAQAVWKRAVDILRRTAPSIPGRLFLGKFVGREQDTFRWRANPGQEILAQMLNQEATKASIEDALTQAGGGSCIFKAVTQASKIDEPAEKKATQFEGELRSLFGNENVIVNNN